MELQTIIFNSELEFRNYVIHNSGRALHIIVFEDVLSNVVFFYCFFQGGLVVAAKEFLWDDSFFVYKEIYEHLATKLRFRLEPYGCQQNVVNIVK